MKKWLTTTFTCTAVLLGGCTGPYSTYHGSTNGGGREYRPHSNAYQPGNNTYQQTQITNVQQNTLIRNQQYNQRITILNQRMQQQQMDLKAQAKQQHLQEMEALRQRHASQEEIATLKKRWHAHEREQETRLRQEHEQEIQQLRQEFAGSAQEQQNSQQRQDTAVQQPTPGQDAAFTPPARDISTSDQPVPMIAPVTTPVAAPVPGSVIGPVGRDALFMNPSAATPTLQSPDQTQSEGAQPTTQAATPQQKRYKRHDSDDAASATPQRSEQAQPTTQKPQQKRKKHRDNDDAASAPSD